MNLLTEANYQTIKSEEYDKDFTFNLYEVSGLNHHHSNVALKIVVVDKGSKQS